MKPEVITGSGSAEPLGATFVEGGVNFAVYSRTALKIFVCLFDENDYEMARISLGQRRGDVHFALVRGIGPGTRYGLRSEGEFQPEEGYYHDRQRLLLDPYVKQIDRAFKHDVRLTAQNRAGFDTASLMPKGIITAPEPKAPKPMALKSSGLIYEVNVRGFTKTHPGVPEAQRGTVAGLGHKSVVSHFLDLGVDAIELMPVTAFIDERHLAPLGLHNAWGYNPVSFFAPDPRLMPGAMAEMRTMTDIYRQHDIPIILDVVYNHTGESDVQGTVLSLKGLDARAYFRHRATNSGCGLVNDTGTGNTMRCDFPIVQKLVIESMRHWVEAGGVSGFRFDLAPILGRSDKGFSPRAELLRRIVDDPILSETILIAEPWDPGPGGYQLGQFGSDFAEWNDRYRDDVRAFWRGDDYKLGALATRLAGSRDIFNGVGDQPSRGVNFVGAHDGFTLRDLVSYEHKHNLANGEENRDGHDHNFSWNNGVEGDTGDWEVNGRRHADMKALLATLFVSRGNLMLAQGDEMGRTQKGNNNAYAQDNEITWLNWLEADRELIGFVGKLQKFRRAHPAISDDRFLSGEDKVGGRDVVWLHPQTGEMTEVVWNKADAGVLGMHLNIEHDQVLVWFNRTREPVMASLPRLAGKGHWALALASTGLAQLEQGQLVLPPRSVVVLVTDQGVSSKNA